MTDASKQITDLSDEKRELLEYLLKEEAYEQEAYPLSFAQQRLWLTEQEQPGSASYNLATAVRIKGRLDLAALERSLNEIIRRQESLRTTFEMASGEPVQLIAPSLYLGLPILDLQYISDSEREAKALEVINEETERPFDLSKWPLLRFLVLKLDKDDLILLVTMHHIISDAWSMGIFVREMGELYEAYSAGKEAELEEPEVQYSDYTLWQRQQAASPRMAEQLEYWREKLSDAPAVLELGVERRAAEDRGHRGAVERFKVDEEVSEGLRRLSRGEGATLYMTLMGAYKVMLMRYSGQQDIVVGTPVANRNRAEVEGVIGFFVNMLAMRTDLSGNPSFRALVNQIKQTTLAAYEHQDFPCERLMWDLRPDRTLDSAPLFQVVFAFDNTPRGSWSLPGLTLSPVEIETSTAKFNLTLIMSERENGLEGYFEYSTDLFERDTIKRMSGHFCQLLRSAVNNPDCPVLDLDMLTPDESHHLLFTNNLTSRPYERHSSISDLFIRQARLTPHRLALSQGSRRLCYSQLNSRANRLANLLISRGVRPDHLVGLCLPRGLDLVVCLLGVIKSGAAYLPLDTHYPTARLSLMIEQASPSLIIADRLARASLPDLSCELLLIDSQADQVEAASDQEPGVKVYAESLAYVSYTSGSTGRPKGVAVTQRGVTRLVRNNTFAELEDGEVILHHSPVSFDASTLELWGALLNGGRVAVLGGEGVAGVEEVAEAVKQEGVTTLWLTAGLMEAVVGRGAAALRGLKQLLAGGDVLSGESVREVVREGVEVINGYGPTEATTFAVCRRMSREEEVGERVAIGRAIANTRVYVLDARMRPVPVGVAGELYIGGDGLARGYVGEAGQTAERFLPDPYSEEVGARMYATGDEVRVRGDGEIEFLGRRDRQVKVRGYRVELGEVEGELRKQEGVEQSCVVVRGEGAAGKQMVGYVVMREGEGFDGERMRREMGLRVPEYMVPGVIEGLGRMPLTGNGKVDRRKLEQMAGGMRSRSRGGEGRAGSERPREGIEEVVAEVWKGVLGLQEVGRDEDFFELGGNSLLGMQVVSRLREVTKVEIKLRSIFEEGTVSGLAERIRRMREEAREGAGAVASGAGEEATRIERRGRKEGELSYEQERMWIVEQMGEGGGAYNIGVRVRVEGEIDEAALRRSLREVSRRHEVLRTRIEEVEGRAVQVVEEGASIEVSLIDVSEMGGSEQEGESLAIAEEAVKEGFDLREAGAVRVREVRRGERESELVVVMHHIVSDGWSMGIFVREMGKLYEAYSAGEEAELDEVEVQYADYAAWQRGRGQSEAMRRQVEYWREQMRGAPTVLELGVERARGVEGVRVGAVERFEVEEEVSEGLRRLSRGEGATLYMTLMAAFGAMLHRISGQQDIVIGTGAANRASLQIEPLIGCFFNLLPIRVDLSGNPTFRALLASVREVVLDAFSHQEVPFEKLVEILQPERDPRYTPLFQVLFEFRSAEAKRLELPGLSLSFEQPRVTTAKYDLTLFIEQGPNGLTGSFEYRTDLFDAATIRRMISQFQTLLTDVVSDPGKELMSLSLSAPEESRRAICSFNEALA